MKTIFTIITLFSTLSSIAFAQEVNELEYSKKSLLLNLYFDNNGIEEHFSGTGFLVKPNDSIYLITNLHIICLKKISVKDTYDDIIMSNPICYRINVNFLDTIGSWGIVDMYDPDVVFFKRGFSDSLLDVVAIKFNSLDTIFNKYIVDYKTCKNGYDFSDSIYTWGYPVSFDPIKEPTKIVSFVAKRKVSDYNDDYHITLNGTFFSGTSGSPVYAKSSNGLSLIGIAKAKKRGLSYNSGVIVDVRKVFDSLSRLP